MCIDIFVVVIAKIGSRHDLASLGLSGTTDETALPLNILSHRGMSMCTTGMIAGEIRDHGPSLCRTLVTPKSFRQVPEYVALASTLVLDLTHERILQDGQ